MFFRISRALVQASLKFSNCSNSKITSKIMFSTKKDIDCLREKAKIAQKVIRMIQNPYEVSELEKLAWGNDISIIRFKSHALAERIKNALAQIQMHNQYGDDILKLFTTGVTPLKQIFHQDRIQHAKTGKKFVYCPNSIISNQIFSILSQEPPSQFQNLTRFVLKGFKGVSKTVSVSLLWHLTRFIDEYRFHTNQKKQTIQEKFTEPIIAYWSIQDNDTFQGALESLLKQLPQLAKVHTVNQIIEKKIKIDKFYQEKFGVQVYLVIDQIHSLAKLYRIIMTQKGKAGKYDEQYEKQRKDLFYQMKFLKKISQKFSKTIYLSSMDIEEDFIQQCDLGCSQKHSLALVKQVKYASLIYNQESLQELCHFFIFEFNEKIIKKQKIQIENKDLILAQAQQKCIQYLKQKLDKQDYFFATFFHIFERIRNLANNKLKTKPDSDYQTIIVEKFKQIIKLTTEATIQEFSKHLFKSDNLDQSRYFLLLKLYEKVGNIVKRQKLAQLNRPFSDQFQSQLYEISLEQLNLTQKKAAKILPLSFFSLPSDQIITLRLPATLVHKILEPKITEQLSFYLSNVNEWMKKSNSVSSLAGTIERLFILALKKGNTTFESKYIFQPTIKHNTVSIKYEEIKSGSYPFTPLNAQENSKSILENVSRSITKMINNEKSNQCAVLQPVKGKFQNVDINDVKDYHHHQTSKVIDLILAKTSLKSVQLDLIDVTVENSQNVVKNKIQAFLNVFLKFKDRNHKTMKIILDQSSVRQIPVTLRYFVYCQKSQIQGFFDHLNDKFGHQLVFKGSNHVQALQVSFKNLQPSLLTQVGFINIQQDVIFEKESTNVDALSFKQACRVLNKRREEEEIQNMKMAQQKKKENKNS